MMLSFVTDSSSPTFLQILDLMKEEFPPETREPDEVLCAEADGVGIQPFRYLAAIEGEKVLGFVRFRKLERLDAGFIVHIAVLESERRRGVGRTLLARVQEELGGRPIFLEVERGDPMDWWVRQGAWILTDTYTQPAVRPDTNPVPFCLMVLGTLTVSPQSMGGFYLDAWALEESHEFVAKALVGLHY